LIGAVKNIKMASEMHATQNLKAHARIRKEGGGHNKKYYAQKND
jgi:hypothetical protein